MYVCMYVCMYVYIYIVRELIYTQAQRKVAAVFCRVHKEHTLSRAPLSGIGSDLQDSSHPSSLYKCYSNPFCEKCLVDSAQLRCSPNVKYLSIVYIL